MRGTLAGMDRFGNYLLGSQMYSNIRDLARAGILHLNDGVWDGKRILSKEWVDWVRRPAMSTGEIGNTYGGQFWLVPVKRTDLTPRPPGPGRAGTSPSLFPPTICS